MSEVHDTQEENPPPIPVKSPLRRLVIARSNTPDEYYDAHLESIDQTITEVECLWSPYAATTSSTSSHFATTTPPPITATSDDASSIYSFDLKEQTVSSAASTNSFSIVATPQSESPPPSSPIKFAYDDEPTVPSVSVLEFPTEDPTFTTEDLFDLISLIPTVDNLRNSNHAKLMHGEKEAADCYMHSYFPSNPSVRPLLQQRNSGLSRTLSTISSSGSNDSRQQKRSSMFLTKRMSLRFPSIKKR